MTECIYLLSKLFIDSFTYSVVPVVREIWNQIEMSERKNE